MKMRSVLCIVFLLVLYIAPMISIPSSDVADRVNNPNMNKDFQVAGYGDESPQSISSFSETLPDDTLFFPDGDMVSSLVLASAGSTVGATTTGNYTFTHVKDASVYYVTDTTPYLSILYLNFTVPADKNFGSIAVGLYAKHYTVVPSANTVDVWDEDASAWDNIGALTFNAFAWINATVDEAHVVDGKIFVRFYLDETDDDPQIHVDYAEVVFTYPLLNDADHYAESFSDVSDWTQVVGGTWGTDDDQMYVDVAKDGVYDIYYTNAPIITNGLNYYYEIRLKNNITDLYKTNVVVRWYSADSLGGSYGQTGNLATSSTATTFKGLIPSNQAIECILVMFYVASSATGPNRFYVDYLRAGPSTETGWQHDGSTTTGISSADGGTIATGGDAVTLTADGDGSTFLIVADTTATAGAIVCAYYPFFSFDIDSGSGSWTLQQWDGAAYATLQSSTAISAGVKRFNMQALDTYVYWLRVTLTASGSLVFDFAKAYSIANFTYTGSGISADDYLYVSSDILTCSGTSFTSIVLDHDPALAVNSATYNVWNVTTGSGIPQTDYYVDTAWVGYSSETEGNLIFGTLTDLRIKFTASANIAAIIFMDYRTWNEVGSVVLTFWLPFDVTNLNIFLVILGMALIPTSACYLVYGGRKNFSTDKLFYGLVAFMLGWGLLIGGIF